MARMPRKGEICTIREVVDYISGNTGEKCLALNLEGYKNPMGHGEWEYGYEAERFVPLRQAEKMMKKETSWSVNVPPQHYTDEMNQLHEYLTTHFEENNILFNSHPDGNGINAALPGKMGNVPIKIRYRYKGDGDGRIGIRSFSPIRIQPDHKAEVYELVHRLNDQMNRPRYCVEPETNLAYSSIEMDIEKWTLGEYQVEDLISFNLFLVSRLTYAMLRVMFGEKADKVIEDLDAKDKEDTLMEDLCLKDKEDTKTHSVDPSNRINNLMGDNPELN
jgi:hypothetical protein